MYKLINNFILIKINKEAVIMIITYLLKIQSLLLGNAEDQRVKRKIQVSLFLLIVV